MAKKTLTWVVSQGFLYGFTPKTHKVVYIYDLFSDLGDVSTIDKSIDTYRSTSSGLLKNDAIYDWFWYALEDKLGLAKVAVRTQQLMDLLQEWLLKARKAGDTDIDVGTEEHLKLARDFDARM